jgi:Phosphotransferase enzyme family
VSLATIQVLARYWATNRDWNGCEAKLNERPNSLGSIASVRGWLSPEAVLDILEASTEIRFELTGPLGGGESGGLEVTEPDGGRSIVKWQLEASGREALRRAVPLAEQLRLTAGWPVGPQQLVETPTATIVLRRRLPGTDVTALTHGLVDELLELHQRRLGIIPTADTTWPAHLIKTLVVGGNTYCRHDVVGSYDERTARIVDFAEAVGTTLEPEDLIGADVVHCDLHPGNLLQVDGTLSGVIDTDFAAVGDAAFDLVTLAVSCREIDCEDGVPERLLGAAFEDLGEVRRRAYLAHLAIKFLDWPIRGDRPAEVELWLAEFTRLLGR